MIKEMPHAAPGMKSRSELRAHERSLDNVNHAVGYRLHGFGKGRAFS